MIKYICKVCSKEFWHYKSRKRKYCSAKCRNIRTQEEKEKFRKLQKQLWQNPDYRKHMSEVHKGHIHSPEQIEKIRIGNIGKKMSEEAKQKISFAIKGSKNGNWKGGIRIAKKGYIDILQPNHPFATKKGYVRRSRLIMEKIIGRYLRPEEVVHHKSITYPFNSIENKQDDRPENLQLFSNESKHRKFHIKLSMIIHT